MKKPQEKQLKHDRMHYVKWIWNEYRSHRPMIVFLLLLTLLSTTAAVLFPIVFKYIIDTLVTGLEKFTAGEISLAEAQKERTRMIFLLLAMGLGPIFTSIYPYFRAKMNIRFEMYFREKFFAEIISKGHKFFLKFRTGDLVTRLTEDIKTWPPGLAWLCCSGIFRAVNSVSVIFFCLLTMMYLNWKLALMACVPLPIMLYVFTRLENEFSESFKEMQEGISDGNDFLEASYSGIRIISSFNSQLPQRSLYERLMQKRIKQEVRVDTLWGLFMIFFEFLNYVGEVLVLIFGGMMVIRGELSLGAYYAFFSYLGMIIYPLMDIPMLLVTLSQAFVAIDRLEALHEADRGWQDQDADGAEEIDQIKEISFNNVTFKHENLGAEDADKASFELQNISFNIRRGEKVAIVGQIGSGKSTLLNLICGVMKPDSGEILINGISLDALHKQSFRDKIGYIQQEPVIFSDTISANIDFWRGYSETLIRSCSKLAQFDNEVLAFPGGYAEPVGQRGVTLSGGQKQRLSIARALVGSPQLLLMDDITASLDAANEQQLWNELDREYSDLTCLIVTHRLATAKKADRIIVLRNGKIEATGHHNDLIKSSFTYQELAS